jgi:hypothetical protein
MSARGLLIPTPAGRSYDQWSRDVYRYLNDLTTRENDPQSVQLAFQTGGEKATTNGMLMWDGVNKYPVVAKDGVWRQIPLADGYALLNQDASITAALADTAYKIQFDTPAMAGGISLDATFPTRIVFAETGIYLLGFSAQITSTNASSVEFRFWPAINGTNVAGSTIVASLKNNGDTTVVSRTALFSMTAGDYLEVEWATTSTSSYLEAHAATGYAPASPSATLSITRLRQ